MVALLAGVGQQHARLYHYALFAHMHMSLRSCRGRPHLSGVLTPPTRLLSLSEDLWDFLGTAVFPAPRWEGENHFENNNNNG